MITAAASLGDKAYGGAIREEIEATTGRKCSIGTLYTTIDRLETKGLLKTWMGDATSQRGGRSGASWFGITHEAEEYNGAWSKKWGECGSALCPKTRSERVRGFLPKSTTAM